MSMFRVIGIDPLSYNPLKSCVMKTLGKEGVKNPQVKQDLRFGVDRNDLSMKQACRACLVGVKPYWYTQEVVTSQAASAANGPIYKKIRGAKSEEEIATYKQQLLLARSKTDLTAYRMICQDLDYSDVSPKELIDKLRYTGLLDYRCLVVETSPGHYQIFVPFDQPLIVNHSLRRTSLHMALCHNMSRQHLLYERMVKASAKGRESSYRKLGEEYQARQAEEQEILREIARTDVNFANPQVERAIEERNLEIFNRLQSMTQVALRADVKALTQPRIARIPAIGTRVIWQNEAAPCISVGEFQRLVIERLFKADGSARKLFDESRYEKPCNRTFNDLSIFPEFTRKTKVKTVPGRPELVDELDDIVSRYDYRPEAPISYLKQERGRRELPDPETVAQQAPTDITGKRRYWINRYTWALSKAGNLQNQEYMDTCWEKVRQFLSIRKSRDLDRDGVDAQKAEFEHCVREIIENSASRPPAERRPDAEIRARAKDEARVLQDHFLDACRDGQIDLKGLCPKTLATVLAGVALHDIDAHEKPGVLHYHFFQPSTELRKMIGPDYAQKLSKFKEAMLGNLKVFQRFDGYARPNTSKARDIALWYGRLDLAARKVRGWCKEIILKLPAVAGGLTLDTRRALLQKQKAMVTCASLKAAPSSVSKFCFSGFKDITPPVETESVEVEMEKSENPFCSFLGVMNALLSPQPAVAAAEAPPIH
jgi:hypothetical protein